MPARKKGKIGQGRLDRIICGTKCLLKLNPFWIFTGILSGRQPICDTRTRPKLESSKSMPDALQKMPAFSRALAPSSTSDLVSSCNKDVTGGPTKPSHHREPGLLMTPGTRQSVSAKEVADRLNILLANHGMKSAGAAHRKTGAILNRGWPKTYHQAPDWWPCKMAVTTDRLDDI